VTVNLIVVGLSHKTAPVEVRERLAFPETALAEVCRRIAAEAGLEEVMVLSTCNRVEVYAVAPSTDAGFSQVSGFLARQTGDHSAQGIEAHLYHYPGLDAIGHMFRVAASLDSMLLGEPQILGQFKDAYAAALSAGSTGVVLNKVAKKAISVAKRVRTETRIAENAVSVSYAAVELARKVFGDLSRHSAMLLGAGEMAELALRHLVQAGCHAVTVVNRTPERARHLAEELGGRAVPFEGFPEAMVEADIVICSTGADHYLVGPDLVAHTLRARKHRPVLLIDISVPRNVDPEVGRLDDAFLYDIDDLQQVVDSNLQERAQEARRAHLIVEEEVDGTVRWLRSLEVVPTITALKGHAQAIARAEADKTLARLSHLSERDRAQVAAMAQSIVNKLLHAPFTSLRREAQERGESEIVEAARRLFALSADAPAPAAAPEDAPAPDPEEGGEGAPAAPEGATGGRRR
jgi:glutamyl-tRNA reductase